MEQKKVRIAHSLQDLQDQIILTLKDKPILTNQNQIDQQDDLLQNQDIHLLNKAAHNAQLRKKIKQMADPSASHMQAKLQGNNNILPHYDDHSFKNDQIQLQSSGKVKIKKGKVFKQNSSLDFMTQKEAQLTKLGSQYTTIKTKNRKEQSNNHNLLDFLNQTAEQPQIKNDFKRDAQHIFQDSINQIKKKRILQKNLHKQIVSVDISSLIQNQQQELLRKSIQRNLKHLSKKNVLDIIKEQCNEQIQGQDTRNNVQIQLNPISYHGDDKKYARKEIDFKQIKSGTTSSMFISLPSQRLKRKIETSDLPESFKQISKQELQKMKEQISFLQDKSLGTGLSDTLKFLRQNSLLKQQQQVGRSTDKSIDYGNDINDRVKLQYRNASGKLMKPKQAFRYLCANFHGEGPGKNKIQKRKKKQLEQVRMKEKSNTDGTLMNLLSQHQQKTNSAYMVIDFGNKKTAK